jgi:cation:H+ antiporter
MLQNPWILFGLSAIVVVVAAIKLAQYGDVIAVRTGLGGLLVGTIFLAAATSLPELITSISAFDAGAPDLAAGNLFGSNMVNILLLALIDLAIYQVPLLRRMAVAHTLTAVLATLLMLLSVIFVLGNINVSIAWVGADSLILIGVYFGGTWLIQQESRFSAGAVQPTPVVVAEGFPSLRRGIAGFLLTAGVLVFAVPRMVDASVAIAEITGLGESFVGTSLLSLVTSLPELLAALVAVRMGAFDLAIGNLFGSSVFNMLALGIADLFYFEGRFLGAIDPSFALVGMLALLLTNMALLGNLARIERKLLFIELDAFAIVSVYFAGMYLLFLRGFSG